MTCTKRSWPLKRPDYITSAFILKCTLVGVLLSGIFSELSRIGLSLIVNPRAVETTSNTAQSMWCESHSESINTVNGAKTYYWSYWGGVTGKIYTQAAWKTVECVSVKPLVDCKDVILLMISESEHCAVKIYRGLRGFFMLEQVNKDKRGSVISRAQLLSELFISQALKKLTQLEASKTHFIC